MTHPPTNPLAVAQESMKMGKETGDRTFRLMAMVMMAGTGIATLLHAIHLTYRDLCSTHQASHPTPPPAPAHGTRHACKTHEYDNNPTGKHWASTHAPRTHGRSEPHTAESRRER